MTDMRITLVNSFFSPWRGGAETYAFNLAKAMVDRGHELTVHCGNSPLQRGILEASGIKIVRHQILAKIYGTPFMPGLMRELGQISSDVIHGNFPSPYIAYSVALASRKRRIPAVLTWHNDLPHVTSVAGLLVRTHDSFVLPKYIRAYRRVIATSAIYAKESRILSSLGGLVTVIPNGVDCEHFNPRLDGRRLRTEFGLESVFTIIFVGALTKCHTYKGLDVLLGAMKIALGERKDLRLLVVGDGELREEYRTMATQLGISPNTLFLGDAPDAELPGYYAASDVTVLPSKDQSEGFGLTILEANAIGKPVVASNVGGIPSVVTHGYNGLLVPPNNISRLAEAILWLSRNRKAVAAMGRNGRKVAEEHDWKKTTTLTERVYIQALAAHVS